MWSGGIPLGAASATLTPNLDSGGTRVTLFETENELTAAGSIELRMSYAFSRDWAAEMGVSYGRPSVRTTISRDFEIGAGTRVASDEVHEYVLDGSLVYEPIAWQFREGRGRMFVLGGIGFLRDLYEERTLIENGRRYHAGGGVKYLFAMRPGRRLRGFGVRADARLSVRDGGVSIEDDSTHRAATVSGGVLLTF
jgi:hypothetical protein